MGILAGQVLNEADLVGLGSWIAYTPTVAGFTLGNGSINGRYIRIGDTIHAEVLVTLGSTSAVTGSMTITIPAQAARNKLVGVALSRPTGAGTLYKMAAYSPGDSTLVVIGILGTSGALAAVSSTTPATWASTGWLLMQVTYEAA